MKQSTKRDLQAENRQNQLLDIALTLFAERGVENVSIKDLATEAKISQGLIYYYFQSKDELLGAVLQRNSPLPEFEAIIEQLTDLPTQDGIVLLAKDLAKLMPEKKLVLRLIMRELLSSRSNVLTHVISFREEVMGRLADYFQLCIDRGELKPHQPFVPIHMIISSFLALLILDQPLEQAVPHFVDIILNGIQAT